MKSIEKYTEFLHSKISLASESGFEIEQSEINPILKPHQRDIVQWAIRGGIGTVPYMAVKMGRRGLSTELNADYFRDSLRYLREAEESATAPTLFDLIN